MLKFSPFRGFFFLAKTVTYVSLAPSHSIISVAMFCHLGMVMIDITEFKPW